MLRSSRRTSDRGVTTSQVVRETDQLIENRLMHQGSNLAYSSEMENYIKVLEGVVSHRSVMKLALLFSDLS